jgi:hypothetical protein
VNRKAATALYALLGSGALTAADLGLVLGGNAVDGESQMSGGDKLSLVAAALGGLAMGGYAGHRGLKPSLNVVQTPDGGVQVSVRGPGAAVEHATPWMPAPQQQRRAA